MDQVSKVGTLGGSDSQASCGRGCPSRSAALAHSLTPVASRPGDWSAERSGGPHPRPASPRREAADMLTGLAHCAALGPSRTSCSRDSACAGTSRARSSRAPSSSRTTATSRSPAGSRLLREGYSRRSVTAGVRSPGIGQRRPADPAPRIRIPSVASGWFSCRRCRPTSSSFTGTVAIATATSDLGATSVIEEQARAGATVRGDGRAAGRLLRDPGHARSGPWCPGCWWRGSPRFPTGPPTGMYRLYDADYAYIREYVEASRDAARCDVSRRRAWRRPSRVPGAPRGAAPPRSAGGSPLRLPPPT